MDIIVTTPRNAIGTAAKEAEDCKREGGGFYFRNLRNKPKNLKPGDKCFYVENGYIRGYAIVDEIREDPGLTCATTGRTFAPGYYVMMDATSWTWIRPIPYQGFQGWRYFQAPAIEIVGGWLDPKPSLYDAIMPLQVKPDDDYTGAHRNIKRLISSSLQLTAIDLIGNASNANSASVGRHEKR